MSKFTSTTVGTVVLLGTLGFSVVSSAVSSAIVSAVSSAVAPAPGGLLADGPAPPPNCWPPFDPCTS
jgi:hypothetical protein